MKFSEIYIKNVLQFREFHLNLTYPDTGKALDKVCFIGANGTGKSTLLKLIINLIYSSQKEYNLSSIFDDFSIKYFRDVMIYFCLQTKSESIYILIISRGIFGFSNSVWNDFIYPKLSQVNFNSSEINLKEINEFKNKSNKELLDRTRLIFNSHDIVGYAQSDGSSLIKDGDLPKADLNQTLSYFQFFLIYHDVSFSNYNDFWKLLIYLIKKRERDYLEFLEKSENQKLTVSEVKEKFDQENPEILIELAEQWNLILERAGLEFDIQNAKIPVQLNENLEAYIRLRESKKNIPYNNLSTGIRNFIFQLGHIYALYFNRDIQRGFLLIDEPESSLFPDLQYDLIERYLSIIQNTQFFVATHSPIIAAQFEPAERFVLEFDEDGYVNARLGVSPEGDDPNDLLANDFVVRSLYGKKGIEQWERYLYLRRKIVETEDMEEKKELLREYSSIGNAYNFLPNEISE